MDVVAAGRILQRLVPTPGPLDSDCWIWPGALSVDGYGYARTNGGHVVTVHRILYEVVVGRVPRGRELHHRCEHRGCANPAHLEPLRKAEHGLRHRRTVCGKGHSLAGGGRLSHGGCRQCRNTRRRQRRAALRTAGATRQQANAV